MKMSKKKKKIIRLLVLLFTIALIIFIREVSRSKLEKLVRSCREYYKPCWKLKYVKEDKEQKQITIYFKYRSHYRERVSRLLNTQKVLTELLVKEEGSQWRDYTAAIMFEHIGDQFEISNISANQKSLVIRGSSGLGIDLKTIAESFPDAKELSLFSALYDSIEEIQGFTDLRRVYFSQGTTDEEKEYILSLFPDCVIEK